MARPPHAESRSLIARDSWLRAARDIAMNHILRLGNDLAAARAELASKANAIRELQIHLASEKFSGTDPDGGRKDWIATSDLRAWLDYINEAGT
jgi:hypothetical protein